jgi:hypothetical protein
MHRVHAYGVDSKFSCTLRSVCIVIHAAWSLGTVMFLTPKKTAR